MLRRNVDKFHDELIEELVKIARQRAMDNFPGYTNIPDKIQELIDSINDLKIISDSN